MPQNLPNIFIHISVHLTFKCSKIHKKEACSLSPKQQPLNLGFVFLKEKSTSDASSGLHGLSYASKDPHAKFQAFIHKIAHSMAQTINNRLVDLKVKLWSNHS